MSKSGISKGGLLTEFDLIKQIIKEVLQQVQDKQEKNEDLLYKQKELAKLYLKIWSALSKFVKTQCDKERIIETSFFGYFYKDKTSNLYVYVPSFEFLESGKLKLINNEQNLISLPKTIDLKHAQFNLQSIAAVCYCKAEDVNNFLNKLKYFIVENVMKKQSQQLQLNFRIGTLIATKGELEFRNSLNQDYQISTKNSIHSTIQKQMNATQNNINYLQQIQSIGKRSASPTVISLHSYNVKLQSQFNGQSPIVKERKSANGSSIQNRNNSFFNAQKQLIDEDQRSHLNDFLKSQSFMVKKDTNIQQSPIKYTNSIIEQLSNLKKQNYSAQEIREKARSFHKNSSIGEDFNNKQQQSILPQVEIPNYIKKTNSQQRPESKQYYLFSNNQEQKQQQNNQNEEIQQIENKTFFNKSFQFQAPDSVIEKALERKKISTQYTMDYPAFLKSNAQFTIYGHLKQKTKDIQYNAKLAKQEAQERLKNELENLKVTREQDKSNHILQLMKEQQLLIAEENLHKHNILENHSYIQMQIQQKQKLKHQMKKENAKLYKTSFGPEETEDLIEEIKRKREEEKSYIKETLTNQIAQRYADRQSNYLNDRQENQQLVKTFTDIIDSEEKARRLRDRETTQKLRKAWQEQIEKSNQKFSYEKIFK